VLGEEAVGVPPLQEQRLLDGPQDTNDACQESCKRVVLKEDTACPELRKDAAERPQINLLVVWEAKDDLRCTVRARLDVRREMVSNEARRAKIDHFDLAARIRANKYVFRLQVAVDQPKTVNELQAHETLLGYLLQSRHREVALSPTLAIKF